GEIAALQESVELSCRTRGDCDDELAQAGRPRVQGRRISGEGKREVRLDGDIEVLFPMPHVRREPRGELDEGRRVILVERCRKDGRLTELEPADRVSAIV